MTLLTKFYKLLQHEFAHAQIITREALALFWRNKWGYLAIGGAGMGIISLLYRFDQALLESLRVPESHSLNVIACKLSDYGRLEYSTLLVCALLYAAAVWKNKLNWKRAAVACMVAGIISGILVTALRPTFGRPRPSSGLEDGFYFLQLSHDYHGFPSGHATTNFATSAALCLAAPEVGIPAMIVAGGVGWARLQLNRHHPSDVFAGALLGALLGGTFGLAAMRRRPYLWHRLQWGNALGHRWQRPRKLASPSVNAE